MAFGRYHNVRDGVEKDILKWAKENNDWKSEIKIIDEKALTPENYTVPAGHQYGDPASDVNRFAHVFTNDLKIGEPTAAQIDDIEDRILKAIPSARSTKSLGSGAADVAVKKGLITPEEAADWSRDRNMRSGYEDKPGAAKKYLNIAEKQSDWAQKGLHSGYKQGPLQASDIEFQKVTPAEAAEDLGGIFKDHAVRWRSDHGHAQEAPYFRYRLKGDPNRGWSYSFDPAQTEADIVRAAREDGSAHTAFGDENARRAQGVPDFPLKNNWHEVTMKRMIRRAIDEGYDGLSWVNGQTVADRYGLSKKIDRITVVPAKDAINPNITWWPDAKGGGSVGSITTDTSGKIIKANTAFDAVGKNISEVIGKALAEKGLAAEKELKIEGVDLDIGGEFHKKFYDEVLPRDTNKMLKKFGMKVEKAAAPSRAEAKGVSGIDLMNEMGIPERDHEAYWRNLTQPQRDRLFEANYAKQRKQRASQQVHVIHFTPEFKQRVLREGFSNFARGGAVKQKAKAALIDTADQLKARAAIRRAMHG